MVVATLTPVRVLFTGSREWTDRKRVNKVMFLLYGIVQQASDQPLVVVHGDARGADRMVRDWVVEAQRRHYLVEQDPHPVTDRMWQLHGKRAGLIRNELMVHKGARLCVAFSRHNSTGTAHCAAKAREAGIPIWWILDGQPALDPPTRFTLGL